MEFFHRPEDPLNQPGYWGARTSAVDWCEPNYTWSFYIAEFFNTITSLPAAFLALNSIYLTYKYGYGKRFYVANAMIAMVGIGSAAFHGTLLWTGQIMDELPMVYAALSFLYSVLEMESDKKPVYKYSAPGITAFAVIFTAVYLYLPDFFIFFVLMFILCVLTFVYHASKICVRPTTTFQQKVFFMAAISSYIGGWLFFWIPEVAACDKLQAYNFHSLWHVTSTIGGFSCIMFCIFQRELVLGRRPQLCYNSFAGIPLVPYVHIPSAKEVEVMEKAEFRRKLEAEELEKNTLSNEARRQKQKRSLISSNPLLSR